MALFNRPQQCAMGIDSGTSNSGVSIVTATDFVLYADVLRPPDDLEILDRIRWLGKQLECLVSQYQPVVIGIEIYTAPKQRMTPRQVAYHNFLIGRCLELGNVVTLEATEWMHQITGLHPRQAIGGKQVIEEAVRRRTAHIFTKNDGGHKSDAAGIAIVALDNWISERYCSQGRSA